MFHFEVDVDRKFSEQRLIFVERDLDAHVFEQKIHCTAEFVGRQFDLLEGLIIHDDIVGAVIIEVRHVTAVNRSQLGFRAGVPGLVRNFASHDIFELGAHDCCTFSWLHVLEFHDLL